MATGTYLDKDGHEDWQLDYDDLEEFSEDPDNDKWYEPIDGHTMDDDD